ncbi:MAG: hypothetical protein IIB56_05600 [Planctomycetes bacterium]|nr:hypothetical protein [Planctomycetota bacterium]
MGILRWQAHLNPVLGAGLILGLGVWLIILYRRQRRQYSAKQALVLVVPKILIVLLLILAYFDPVWSVMQRPDENQKVLALVDISSSMEVEDKAEGSRGKRAYTMLEKLTQKLRSSYIDFDTLEFDSEVRKKEEQLAEGIRETDLGKCLVTIADKPDPAALGLSKPTVGGSKYMGVLLLTDGGDEVVQNVKLPEVPVYIVGVGSEPETWNDIAITRIDAPDVVEEQSDFEVTADIVARCASYSFATGAEWVTVRVEAKDGQDWETRDSKLVDLTDSRARVKFIVKSPSEMGTKKYRVRVETIDGELSALNNTRIFSIEVRKNTLSVLLFAQQLGWDFRQIYKELSDDTSVALTALFRVSSDRFIVRGSRQKGDENLEAGFPSTKGLLDLYKCVIVGSFPAWQWQQEQLQALVEYVREGGAVIFLGGEYSFGQGGYSRTVIEPLFPWRISAGEPELQTGRFTVNVPLSAANHSIVSEMSRLIGQAPASNERGQASGATIESINLSGPLRSGAINLLDASVGNRTVSVVALQRFGQGQTMGVATNTLWKWTHASDVLKQAYSHFWRQSVRNVSQWEEGERFVGVKWDKKGYKPGEQASTTIRVAGRYNPGQLHLKATLTILDTGYSMLDTRRESRIENRESRLVSVEPVMGRENTFRAEMVFSERAEYLFEVQAYVGEKLLESYKKTLVVGPSLNEGANLEVDHAFLDNLAMQSGGAYFRETDFENLVETLRSKVIDYAVSVEIPLVQDKYIYILIFLGILMLEWTMRRKMNLF